MRAIVTVVGMDRPGIVAAISTVLANNSVNINDISQSYTRDFFTMILVVDFVNTTATLKQVEDDLKVAGKELDVVVTVFHEDVFKAMHRI